MMQTVMRHFSAFVILAGMSAMAGMAKASTSDGRQVLTGAAASEMIRMTLAEQNLDGDPAIADERVFPDCEGSVTITPMFGGWNTIRLKCNAEKSWQFAIRTNLTTKAVPVPIREFKPNRAPDGPIQRMSTRSSAAVSDEIEVVALVRSVSKGDVITIDDVTTVPVPARNVSGAFFDIRNVIGRRMKSSLSARRPVQARHLFPDFMVEEGGEVVIFGSAGGISVDMLGFARENGQIGDWIKVENASSGKTIRAKVIGEKKVAVIAKKG